MTPGLWKMAPCGRAVAEAVYSLVSMLVDVAVDVPRLPQRGSDVFATGTRTTPGGGFNLAAAVARQGVRCVYGAPHGTGPYGDLIRHGLAAEGVEVAGTPRGDGDSGFCVALVEPDGERTFVTMPGVESTTTVDDLAAIDPSAGDAIAVSGYDLAYPGSGPALATWLGGLPSDVLVALDPGPLLLEVPAERMGRVLRRTTLLTLSQPEAHLVSGADRATGAALLDAVRCRLPLPPRALIVLREGPTGCVATGGALGERVVEVPAPQVEAVDTTGAGDAHLGVLLARLVSGCGVEEALAAATHAAALSVTRLGPATSPTSAELAEIDPQWTALR